MCNIVCFSQKASEQREVYVDPSCCFFLPDQRHYHVPVIFCDHQIYQ